jgi:preprotein translocase subunit YajC
MIRSFRQVLSTVAILSVFSAASFAAPADPSQAAANPLGSFVPLIVIFVIFYFFLIRPQQKKAKEHQKTLNALKKDDRIVTAGGIYGTVAAVKGDTLEVKIADAVKVTVAKSAITAVLPPEGQTVTPEIVK